MKILPFKKVESWIDQYIIRFFAISRESPFAHYLSGLLLLIGVTLGWTNQSVSSIFFEKFLRIFCFTTLLASLMAKRKFFYHLSLLSVVFYPMLIFLTPSTHQFINYELSKLVSLKNFMQDNIFESNMINLVVTNEDIHYFLSFGYYVSLLGFLIGIREIKTFKWIVKVVLISGSFLIVIWLLLASSIYLMNRDKAFGKSVYLLLKHLNTFSHVINDYDYIYFKAGEFDQNKGKESWERTFYQAVIYKNNNDFIRSLDLLKRLRSHKTSLINLQLADMASRVPKSTLSRGEKINLLSNIYIYYPHPDIAIYLALLYFENKTYHSVISLINDAIPHVRNKYILADLYNVLGDSYGGMNEVYAARFHYKKSLMMFDRIRSGNFHAYKGLAGW